MLGKPTFVVLLLASSLLAQTPTIVSTYPTPNALSVPLDTTISVTFGVDMNPATINANTFVVHGNYTGKLSGSYSYDSPTKTATFIPGSPFKVGEQVSVSLTTGVASATGDTLASAFTWSFTTEVSGGSGAFADAGYYDTGISSDPLSVTAADLDGDGDIDLAVANNQYDNVSVFLNDGTGIFTTAVNYSVGDMPISVTAADLDGDGDSDLAATNCLGDNVSVLLNDGTGIFAAAVNYGTGDAPCFVTAADLDGDGDNDLAVANAEMGENISVLFNDGSGSFAAAVNYNTGFGPRSIAAADLDEDGDCDLAVANEDSNNVSVLLNDGSGSFAAAVNHAVEPWRPRDVIAKDLDGDGDGDLVVTTSDNKVSVLLNDGSGSFVSAVVYDAGSYPNSVTAADLDGDEDIDLVVTNRSSDNVSVLLNDGSATFAAAVNYGAGDYPNLAVAADLDDDGDNDLAVVNRSSADVTVLLNLNSTADIALSTDILSFNPTDVGAADTLSFTVYNHAVDSILHVGSITSSNAVFTANPGSFSVPPGDSAEVSVTFTPDDMGTYNDSLTITSNDPQQPEVKVSVYGMRSNTAPVIASADTVQATENQRMVYFAEATDADDDTLTWLFDQLPAWLAADADSVFGTPLEGDADTSFRVIVSDGFLSDTLKVVVTVLPVNDPPEPFALHQNYPNPFNPTTTIRFDLPMATEVRLVVYDLLGREVVRLADGRLEAGYQVVVWNGRDSGGREVPTGMYIAWMLVPPEAGVTQEYSQSIKLLLLK